MMPEPGPQKPSPYFEAEERRKSKTSRLSLLARLVSASAPSNAVMRWSQWTVVGDGCRGLARLHELEDGHLAGHVLQADAVGAEVEVALAGEKVGVAGVVEVSEQDLLGRR